MRLRIVAQSLWRSLPLAARHKARIRQVLWRLRPQRRSAAAPAVQTLGQACEQPTRFTHPGHRDWIIFAIIGWDFRIQRPQHLARELARAGETVFYIEPSFVPDPHPGAEIRQIDPDLPLYAVQLHLDGAPQIYFEPAGDARSAQLRASIALLWARWGIQAATAVVQHPYWAGLALSLPDTLQIYDCMDHHEGFGGMPAELLAQERAYLARADAITVTSQWLLDWVAANGRPDARIVRNGCDYEHFRIAAPSVPPQRTRRRVLGYFGAIAEWFDVELVALLARRFPDCDLVLVGNDTVQAGKTLAKLSNVQLPGEKPYAELPQYLQNFDVCLLPFRRIALTEATNPVKVYEYLCAGAEVVCTDLPEVAQFGELVHRADSHDTFVEVVEQALRNPADEATRARRRAFARSQTWAQRAAALRTLARSIRFPSVSIVVLTYNNWAYTEACLRSLLTRTDYPGDWEIVVTDNASSDGTPARLQQWARNEPRLRLVLNETNLGFAAGNNSGIAAATGDYLVLLNNDTVVTRGWLLTMLRHFQADPQLGLLGPATNHIGNESRVPVHYERLEDMPAAARAWTLAHMGQTWPSSTLAFFCVMLPRRVLERVGLLDEAFARGFFEDDDYCRRVEQLGLRLACADDVLVHHRLSASFDQVDTRERQELFTRNKAYYESKWGTWEPHRYREV